MILCGCTKKYYPIEGIEIPDYLRSPEYQTELPPFYCHESPTPEECASFELVQVLVENVRTCETSRKGLVKIIDAIGGKKHENKISK